MSARVYAMEQLVWGVSLRRHSLTVAVGRGVR